ncbi:MAG: hypothetical protein ACXWXK_05815 [Actinomycetota bacterium]
MSTPARKLAPAPAAPARRGAHAPAPRPAREPEARRPASSTRRHKKRHHLGFAVLASTLVALMVLSIVVLHALLAQQSFRIDEAERRLEALGTDPLELVTQQATLSAPGRIASWASRHGMRLPDDIRILRAPNGPDDSAGADPPSQDGTDR